MKRVIIAVFLQLGILSCANADQGRIVTMYGKGNESCGTFLTVLSKSPINEGVEFKGESYASESLLYSEWLLSFVTAFNMLNSQQKNIANADYNGVTLWAKNWCEDHPMKNLGNAAWALVIEQSGFDINLFK